MLNAGDRVLIEDPHYLGVGAVLATTDAELVPCPVDAEGMRLPRGENAAAALAYVTPSHQFPTGAVMSIKRRIALLDWGAEHGAMVIEDDYDSEFRYSGSPFAAIAALTESMRVIYVGTFSKVLFPALRLGFAVLPPKLVTPFSNAKWLGDRQSPMLSQIALSELLASGDYERQIRTGRVRNEKRRQTLLSALADAFGGALEVEGNVSGMHCVGWLNGWTQAALADLLAETRQQGVAVHDVAPLFLNGQTPDGRCGLLFGFSALTPTQIQSGVERLHTAAVAVAQRWRLPDIPT